MHEADRFEIKEKAHRYESSYPVGLSRRMPVALLMSAAILIVMYALQTPQVLLRLATVGGNDQHWGVPAEPTETETPTVIVFESTSENGEHDA